MRTRTVCPKPIPAALPPEAGRALGVDVSRWNGGLDFAALKAGGVSFVIFKVSQGREMHDVMRLSHNRFARDAGLICGVYHWCDPNHDPQAQVDNFVRATQGLSFDFCAVDVEQHWSDWREWAASKISAAVPAAQISRCARQTAEGIRQATRRPTLIYTRRTFIEAHAAPMLEWLPGWDVWLAQYPYPRGRVTLTWQVLLGEHLPLGLQPALPQGCAGWRFWQFSGDRFILPGSGGRPIDLNFFNGDEQALRAWCRAEVKPPPAAASAGLTLEERVRRLWDAHPDLHP